MNTSCIAILTFRRLNALQPFIEDLLKHVPEGTPIAVFEDCANYDDTYGYLTTGATQAGHDDELEADVYRHPRYTAYLGSRNLGVAGNSNRAIRWFERMKAEPNAPDHLCLCNDDLVATGDFTAEYRTAHADLKIGLFCFCPVKLGDEYVGPSVKVLGHNIRMVPRMTGPMMSITRALVERIGYYDVAFGRAGEEHCDYTNRARFAGFIQLRGKQQQCLDVVSKTLDYRYDLPSSITASEKATYDQYAAQAMHRIAPGYQTRDWYRPFRLLHGLNAGAYGGVGIPVQLLQDVGYQLVVDYTMNDAASTPA